MTALPLTDDQLRQVAAHYAVEAVRLAADDTMGHLEALDDALDTLGIASFDPQTLTNELSDAIAERLGDLLDTAEVTITWPDEPVRAFAAKLRAELEKLRESHEQRGLLPGALAYTGAVASLDAALAELNSEADA